MIPQNTIVITKEMINQFGLEITEMQSEFERYNSWFNAFQFQLFGAIGKLKLYKKMVQI
jgi:predicted methyltransferase